VLVVVVAVQLVTVLIMALVAQVEGLPMETTFL
jgi:hypothetical protein